MLKFRHVIYATLASLFLLIGAMLLISRYAPRGYGLVDLIASEVVFSKACMSIMLIVALWSLVKNISMRRSICDRPEENNSKGVIVFQCILLVMALTTDVYNISYTYYTVRNLTIDVMALAYAAVLTVLSFGIFCLMLPYIALLIIVGDRRA